MSDKIVQLSIHQVLHDLERYNILFRVRSAASVSTLSKVRMSARSAQCRQYSDLEYLFILCVVARKYLLSHPL